MEIKTQRCGSTVRIGNSELNFKENITEGGSSDFRCLERVIVRKRQNSPIKTRQSLLS